MSQEIYTDLRFSNIGIDISHRAALTFSLSERSVLETGPSDIVWQGFSAAFDMFIEEVWVLRL